MCPVSIGQLSNRINGVASQTKVRRSKKTVEIVPNLGRCQMFLKSITKWMPVKICIADKAKRMGGSFWFCCF